MMRILSAEAMREVDRRSIEEIGIPSLVLMENAALGVADAIAALGEDGSGEPVEGVAIFCGPGNNGGDGLALARHLDARGLALQVFLMTGGRELSGDAAIQRRICLEQGVAIREIEPGEGLGPVLAAAAESDLVVDALFGTGLARSLEGSFSELVEGLNELPVRRLAVDIPSGLGGSRREVFGPRFEADLTVTFAAPKIATVFPPAADAVGDLIVTDLGIPPRLVDEVEGPEGRIFLLRAEDVAGSLPPRDAESHKGSYGHALIVAGSPGKAGAAILAARAAVRGGAGLVTAAVPERLLDAVELGSIESMTLPLTPDGGGEGDETGEIGARAILEIREALPGKTVLALGPGLGSRPATAAAIRELVASLGAGGELPLVLDADALNAFAGRAGELAAGSGDPTARSGGNSVATVLTPHAGELARLLAVPTAEVVEDRIAAARRGAAESGAMVVLKGQPTLITLPGGEVYVAPVGNPGMATGGSGDVLTGLLAALLGRRLPALLAVQLGVVLHGLAGDVAGERSGQESMSAGDMVEALPEAFRRLDES